MDGASSGRGRLFLISGEPGIGKTWLADEVARQAAERGMRVTWGRCWEGGGAPAYWPWIQVIRGTIAEPETPGARSRNFPAEIARMLPELASEAHAADAQGDAEQARFRMFDAVAALLKDSAREHPLLIVIDDLHEADLPSLQMLKFAVRVLHDAPVLIIGTYRNAEMRRSPERLRVIEETLRDGYQIPISGLAEAEVGRMVAARSDQSASTEFVAQLHRATAGNPLFIDGVLRVLAAEGRLSANERIDLAGFKLPDSVRGAIARRLEMLSPEACSVFVTAAMIGDEFELDLVSRVSARPSETVSKLIREAEDLGIVSHVTYGRWRFSHPLLREWLLNEPVCGELLIFPESAIRHTQDTRKHRVASDIIYLLYFYKTGVGRPREIVTKMRFIVETYCTVTYLGFFGSDDTLASIIGKIRNTGEQHPACALLDELDDIHDYSRDYLCGDDLGGDATEVFDVKELTGFVRRTLKIANAIPNLP